MAKRHKDPQGLVPEKSATVMLILDLISDFAFEDGRAIARAARPIAERIAKLKARLKETAVPVIYVNDDIGRWRSDFPGLLRHCRDSPLGAPISQLIAPEPDDFCILKPKHSGFFATALETVLQMLEAKRLILTGVSSNQCVLFTANDAYVRDFELLVPRDCISARKPKDTALALQYFRSVLSADVTPSTRLRLPKAHAR